MTIVLLYAITYRIVPIKKLLLSTSLRLKGVPWYPEPGFKELFNRLGSNDM